MNHDDFKVEVLGGARFEFGKNWREFLQKLDRNRIDIAELSILNMLQTKSLKGKTFLDIGSGSGLSSLAAVNAGASVTSFDYDDSSVWCTNFLKAKYCSDNSLWQIKQGSILDRKFLGSLGSYDIVYSWGVLHHTGRMWGAIDNAAELVNDGGTFFIAIYNNQGLRSHIWWIIKWFYNKLPTILKKPYAYTAALIIKFLLLIKYSVMLKPMILIDTMIHYEKKRGMSFWSDVVDWYGGFPYEFADYDSLVDYIENKGFKLQRGRRIARGHGCHELIFTKN